MRYYIVQYEDARQGWTDIPEWARKTEHACLRLMKALGMGNLRVLRKPHGWCPEVEATDEVPATLGFVSRAWTDNGQIKSEMRQKQERKS